MSYANIIINTISSKLNNPILKALKEIRITSLLKKSLGLNEKYGGLNNHFFL